jgi:CubicO group peptidase (beta-lactamase class C family)
MPVPEARTDALQEAASVLRDGLRRTAADWSVPGLALAVTDRHRTLLTLVAGCSDLESGTPVTPATVFRIGSITKPVAALATLRLAERGLLDLDAEVTEYLPWFSVRGGTEGITLHRLLSHTAGLVPGLLRSPTSLGEALSLAETHGFAPGERWVYSNAAYSVLGLVLERAAGRPVGEVLREEVLVPAGMEATLPVVTNEHRGRLATGYEPPDFRVPWHPRLPLAPAAWLEWDCAGGSVAAPVSDMAKLVRVLLNEGDGVVERASFERMATPVAAGYGYGLVAWDAGGRRRLGHGGANPGFQSMLEVDPDAGVGAIVLANSLPLTFAAPAVLAAAACDLFAAAVEGRPLPETELPPDLRRVPDAETYAGRYRAGGAELDVIADDGGLRLRRGGAEAVLERFEQDAFYPLGEAPAPHLLRFRREDGRVVEAVEGERWYARERGPALPVEDVPAGLAPLLGTYRAWLGWGGEYRIFWRRDALMVAFGDVREARLEPAGERTFRAEPPDLWLPCEIRAGEEVEGRVARIECDGIAFHRAA